jgi:hypothetical protein
MVKVTGLSGVVSAYNAYPKAFKVEMSKTLVIHGNKMENSARGDHRYKRKSGRLDAAIQSVVDAKNVFLKFWIDPQSLTSGKYNYGVIQHEGSYSKYRPSGLTQRYASKKAKNGGGIKHDYFMLRAWNKIMPKMQRELVKDMIQVTKKLGF